MPRDPAVVREQLPDIAIPEQGGTVPSESEPRRNYGALYHLEPYLFETVHQRFQEDGELSGFDFFCILIWKSNRAKSHHARRMGEVGTGVLESAVRELTRGLYQCDTNRARFAYLVEDWGFRLPTASAVLTVCFPDRFSVYDWRVCDELGEFQGLEDRTSVVALWEGYQAYIQAVREAAPAELSLRDKDRWLWGRSFARQLEADLTAEFER